jgi:hypothetical protein
MPRLQKRLPLVLLLRFERPRHRALEHFGLQFGDDLVNLGWRQQFATVSGYDYAHGKRLVLFSVRHASCCSLRITLTNVMPRFSKPSSFSEELLDLATYSFLLHGCLTLRRRFPRYQAPLMRRKIPSDDSALIVAPPADGHVKLVIFPFLYVCSEGIRLFNRLL